MENNKKIFFVIIIVVLLGAVGFLIYLNSSTDKEIGFIDNIKNVVNLPDDEEKEPINASYSFREGSFIELLQGLSVEETATLKETKHYLYSDKVSTICAKQSGAEQTECFDSLKAYQAILLENPNLCKQAGSKQNDCLKNIAFRKNDVSVCSSITDQNFKNECSDELIIQQATDALDINKCQGIVDRDKAEACIVMVVSLSDGTNLCSSDYVVSNSLVEECNSIALLIQAISTQNASLCEQITIQKYKDNCVFDY